jgi:hypothetical protein
MTTRSLPFVFRGVTGDRRAARLWADGSQTLRSSLMSFVSPRQRLRFRPRVEALEDRLVPTILQPINQTGSTLIIACDNSPNNLTFNDNGQGAIDVLVNGSFFLNFTGVNTLNVATGSGNDTIKYHLAGDLVFGQSRTVNVAMGNGNNSFTANLNGRTLQSSVLGSAAASLSFNIRGGQGNNKITFNANNMKLQPKTTLNETVPGGIGNDTITSNFSGLLNGLFNPQLDGGRGHNVVKVFVDVTQDSSLGTVGTSSTTSKLKGTFGVNAFTYIVHTQQPNPNNFIFAEIDAGSSLDTAVFTSFTPPGSKTPAFVTVKSFSKGKTTALPFTP